MSIPFPDFTTRPWWDRRNPIWGYTGLLHPGEGVYIYGEDNEVRPAKIAQMVSARNSLGPSSAVQAAEADLAYVFTQAAQAPDTLRRDLVYLILRVTGGTIRDETLRVVGDYLHREAAKPSEAYQPPNFSALEVDALVPLMGAPTDLAQLQRWVQRSELILPACRRFISSVSNADRLPWKRAINICSMETPSGRFSMAIRLRVSPGFTT